MNVNLIVLAVLPSIALMFYIYKADKADKEPFSQLLKVFIGGLFIGCLGAEIFEILGDKVLSSFLNPNGMVYNFLNCFFVIGLSEECFKFLALHLFTRKNKNFNSLFDGMIYSVCASLGFATLENILYVVLDDNGLEVALSRAVISVPGHFFFGVFMGYFYSYYRMNKLAIKVENEYANAGVITRRNPPIEYKLYLVMALVIPIALHGFFDFCLNDGTAAMIICFFALVIALYIFGFSRVKKLSKQDMADNVYVYSLLYKKYPELQQFIYQQQLQQQQQQAAQQYAYQAQQYSQPTYQQPQQSDYSNYINQ